MLCHFFNCTVYEIMWKNNVEVARPQMTIWHMHIACCLTKATDIHSEYVILIAFPLQQWLHECTSMFNVILYIYCLSHNLYGFSAQQELHKPGMPSCCLSRTQLKMHMQTKIVSDLNSCFQPGRGLHNLQQDVLFGFNTLFYCFKSGLLAGHISYAPTNVQPHRKESVVERSYECTWLSENVLNCCD